MNYIYEVLVPFLRSHLFVGRDVCTGESHLFVGNVARPVPAKSVSFLLAKVQILHYVQNDKTWFLIPVRGCHAVPRTPVGRDWRCRIFPLTRVYCASNPPLYVVVVVGGLRGCNIAVIPMSQPPQSRPTATRGMA